MTNIIVRPSSMVCLLLLLDSIPRLLYYHYPRAVWRCCLVLLGLLNRTVLLFPCIHSDSSWWHHSLLLNHFISVCCCVLQRDSGRRVVVWLRKEGRTNRKPVLMASEYGSEVGESSSLALMTSEYGSELGSQSVRSTLVVKKSSRNVVVNTWLEYESSTI